MLQKISGSRSPPNLAPPLEECGTPAATPNLMLLDDQFMLAPFYAEYAAAFHEPQDLDDIVKQFTLLDQHTRDAGTGLMYHGWDESHTAPWANVNTGTSPNLWARGMGWYLMALVDTLPYIPEHDPHHAVLLAMLLRAAAAVERAQDPQSNLWYQILDKPGAKENYIESSSVLMFTYAFAKGARLGYLPEQYGIAAARAWKAIRHAFRRGDRIGRSKDYRYGYAYFARRQLLRTTGAMATICTLPWSTTIPRESAPFYSREAKWNC